MPEAASTAGIVTPDRFEAVLFDLDGVLTDTASIHAACWKAVFDPILERWAKAHREPFRPFDEDRDYRAHVDGRDRFDGVRSLLASRGIGLPEGDGDAESAGDTVRGIALEKTRRFERALRSGGVRVYPGSLRWLRHLRSLPIRTAVVSASHHCREVLRSAGIEELFETRVDGRTADELHLAGKPAPDCFLEAARRLEATPARAVVVEDALAGVAAGRAGAFGLVIGVARQADPEQMRSAGADLVVRDLEELLP